MFGTLNGLLDAPNTLSWLLLAFSLDQKALGTLLDQFIKLESQQEKLKADLHQTSADQIVVRKNLLVEFGRWVSVLEGHLGKNSAKLTEFGIAPRQLRPHKGPRTTASSEA